MEAAVTVLWETQRLQHIAGPDELEHGFLAFRKAQNLGNSLKWLINVLTVDDARSLRSLAARMFDFGPGRVVDSIPLPPTSCSIIGICSKEHSGCLLAKEC